MAAPDPHRPRYVATATVSADLRTVSGAETVTFTPDLPTDQLVFRLWPNEPVEAAAGIHEITGPVTSDSTALASSAPDPTTVVVALGRTLAAGESVTVRVPWSLSVGGSVHERVSHSGDSLRLGSFLPTLGWEPGVGWTRDPPTALFAEASTSPTADYDVAIAAPAGYDVLASGARAADGHFRATAVRDFAASIGHFDIVTSTEHLPDPVTVTVGVDQSMAGADDPNLYLVGVVSALRDYATRFGPYPWSTFSLALTPGLDGNGIEYPTMVLQGARTSGRTTPHEVAHQWFYGLVGDDQARDPWLDEGLASYAEFTHNGTLARFEAMPIPPAAAGHGGAPMTYWAPYASSYYRGVYVQPAVAVARLGTQFFVDCALRQYVARNAYRIATPAEFLAAISIVFPDAAAKLAPAGLRG